MAALRSMAWAQGFDASSLSSQAASRPAQSASHPLDERRRRRSVLRTQYVVGQPALTAMSQKLEEAYLECLLPGQLMVHTVNVDGCRRFCRDSELPGMQAYIDTVVAASGDNPADPDLFWVINLEEMKDHIGKTQEAAAAALRGEATPAQLERVETLKLREGWHGLEVQPSGKEGQFLWYWGQAVIVSANLLPYLHAIVVDTYGDTGKPHHLFFGDSERYLPGLTYEAPPFFSAAAAAAEQQSASRLGAALDSDDFGDPELRAFFTGGLDAAIAQSLRRPLTEAESRHARSGRKLMLILKDDPESTIISPSNCLVLAFIYAPVRSHPLYTSPADMVQKMMDRDAFLRLTFGRGLNQLLLAGARVMISGDLNTEAAPEAAGVHLHQYGTFDAWLDAAVVGGGDWVSLLSDRPATRISKLSTSSIDHIIVSKNLKKAVVAADVMYSQHKASDHVPVWAAVEFRTR